MACIATGRPTHLLVRAAGPVGPGDRRASIVCSNAACASSAAMRRIVSAGDAGLAATRVGRIFVVEEALGDQLEDRHARAAVGSVNAPTSAGRDVRRAAASASVAGRLVEGERLALGVAREQPVVGGARRRRITSHGALV